MSAWQEQLGRQSDNTYVIDSESAAEMARLMRQDYLLTQGMGGYFLKGLISQTFMTFSMLPAVREAGYSK